MLQTQYIIRRTTQIANLFQAWATNDKARVTRVPMNLDTLRGDQRQIEVGEVAVADHNAIEIEGERVAAVRDGDLIELRLRQVKVGACTGR